MVMVGLARPEVTKLLPSQRKKFLTSWLRWSELITDVFGSFPASGAEKMLGELLPPWPGTSSVSALRRSQRSHERVRTSNSQASTQQEKIAAVELVHSEWSKIP